MKKAFENSCLKGCMVYMVALVLLLVISTAGLGSLGAKFGVGAQGSKPGAASKNTLPPAATAPQGGSTAGSSAAQPTDSQQAPAQAQAQTPAGGQQQPIISVSIAPTVVINIQTGSAPAPAAQQSAQQATSSAPPAQSGTVALPPIQVQADGISGEATTPFYIVQPGDTLWEIASRFGTTVDALQSANKLGEDFIQPRQLLYLPQPSQPQGQPTPGQQQSPGGGVVPPPIDPNGSAQTVPSMPRTGIHK